MNCKLHKISKEFVITSDEFPYPNDIVLSTVTNTLVTFTDPRFFSENTYFKVIAQQNQIDFSSLSEEEQKKIGWFSLIPTKYCIPNKHYISEDDKKCYDVGYVDGFLKALELLSDRVFTLEHIRKAIKYGSDFAFSCTHSSDYMTKEELKNAEQSEEQFIQSLSQSKSWKIEIEMEQYVQEETGTELKWVGLRPKFIDGKIKITKIL